jgi:transporter family-2 protein
MTGQRSLWPVSAAVVVGALAALQSQVNGSLADVLGNGLEAALISFGVGLVLLTLMGLGLARMRAGVRRLLIAVRSGAIPRWQVFGGLLGAFFVLTQSMSVPVGGVALFAITTVAGQVTASLIVDRIGLGPFGRQPVSSTRVISAIIAIAAVGSAVTGRWGGEGLSLLLVVMGLVAGAAVGVQAAINGRVSSVSGEPLVAAWMNFIVGTSALMVAVLIATSTGLTDLSIPADSQAWLYTGGLIGVVFVATTAWVVGRVGVLRQALLAIAGQLLGSIILDLLFTDYVDVGLVLGTVLAFVAVVISTAGRRPVPDRIAT